MKKTYLIFGKYPTAENIKDGMIQRIKAIDEELKDYRRIYVTLSLFKLKKRKEIINSSVTIYSLNFFIHYILMLSLLKQVDAIYFHSILNYKYAAFYPITWVKKIFLDFHGAVPEEYQYLKGNKFKYIIICWLERRAVKKCNILVCVSHNMYEHFIQKYPFLHKKHFIIKPIVPTNSLIDKKFQPEIFKREKGINMDSTVIIYSGNLQAWQNFNLMIKFIQDTRNFNYVYIILTGERENAIKKLRESECKMDNIIIDSVLPEDLYKYYSIAHYGFLLRDEHVLNKVAAPTKLVEYLYYGIIPILKYEAIGDQEYYKYEYVSCNSASIKQLLPYKSSLNKEIAHKILDLTFNASVHI